MEKSPSLTWRQRAYLSKIASGLTARRAAESEFVHPQAIHHAMMRAKARLGADTLPHLTALAVERGEIMYTREGEFVPAEVAR